MKPKLMLLSIFLLVQLGVAYGLHVSNHSLTAFNATQKLLTFNINNLDELVFKGPDQQEIVVRKNDGHWMLPDHFGAVADQARIKNLLQRLGTMKRPWPVAESSDVRTRFKVADNAFERRLEFREKGETRADLLLGSSPGFRKVHARLKGEDKIYDIPFSTYRVSLKAQDWVDKNPLKLDRAKIDSIDLSDCRLLRRDGKFVVDGLSDSQQTDADKVKALVNKLSELRILDVVDPGTRGTEDNITLDIKLVLTDGTHRRYQWMKGAKEGDLLLRVSGQPSLYKVPSSQIDELKGYQRSALVKLNSRQQSKSEVAEPQQG